MKRKRRYKIRDFSPLQIAIIIATPGILWTAMYGACHLIVAINSLI